jgi:hypothetical protein
MQATDLRNHPIKRGRLVLDDGAVDRCMAIVRMRGNRRVSNDPFP